MARETDDTDPKGLIYESYRIEGIGAPECRSIFLDWAMSVPQGIETGPLITRLLERYGEVHPDHPMTTILKAALAPRMAGLRRGGARGRRTHDG